jgi:hypothetical protein
MPDTQAAYIYNAAAGRSGLFVAKGRQNREAGG